MAAQSTASIQFQSVSNPMNYNTVTSNSTGYNTGSNNQAGYDTMGYNSVSNIQAGFGTAQQNTQPLNLENQGQAMDTATGGIRRSKSLPQCLSCAIM